MIIVPSYRTYPSGGGDGWVSYLAPSNWDNVSNMTWDGSKYTLSTMASIHTMETQSLVIWDNFRPAECRVTLFKPSGGTSTVQNIQLVDWIDEPLVTPVNFSADPEDTEFEKIFSLEWGAASGSGFDLQWFRIQEDLNTGVELRGLDFRGTWEPEPEI